MIILYSVILIFLAVYSWGFVDANMSVQTLPVLYNLVNYERNVSTIIYSLIQVFLFIFYAWVLRKIKQKSFSSRDVWKLIFLSCVLLFFSFPGLSYDIFNYIATARVTYFYGENPYVVMPIEISNEPSLAFLHASNKIALYGPSWILFSAVPHYLGMNNLVITIFTFKALIALWFLLLLYLIWSVSNKSAWSLAFFGLNPLVVVETLVSSHNDVVMMALLVGSFYVLKKKRYIFSFVLLILSVLIKYATIFVVPVYLFVLWKIFSNKKYHDNTIWFWCAISLYTIFALSPLREELYAWYLIWPLTFVALIPQQSYLVYLTLGFSVGLPLRLTPYLFTREWGGITPIIKKIVTLVPAFFASFYYAFKKIR